MIGPVRYDCSGRWFKGNVHIHSTVSDGGMDFGEIARLYAGGGYDFLFRTDHWIPSDVQADGQEYPLLWLDGLELDGRDEAGVPFHVLCLGRFTGITRDMGLPKAVQAVVDQGGLLVLAHPYWTGDTPADAFRWPFDGVEVYNHVCQWLNGKGDSGVHWNAMLQAGRPTLGFAVDDAHLRPAHPGWNGGWIVVNAPELSRPAIGGAIRAGNFYSSCGPEIRSIERSGQTVRVTCSPAQFIRLVGPRHEGMRVGSFKRKRFSEATFEIPEHWNYAYLEVEDSRGRRAWSNSLFVKQGENP